MEQKWLDSEKGKICYFLNRGSEKLPSVIFLHGLSANHTTWIAAAEKLSQLGFSCLMLDLRGHGYSDKTKKRSWYKIPVFTEDLNKIVEKEKLSQAILVGYSFGGFIALDYTIKYPGKMAALVLASTNHTNPLKYKHLNFLTWPAYSVVNLLAYFLIRQRRKKYYYFNQATDLGYWRSVLKGYLTMPLSINFWMLSEIANIDFSQDIERINCPTLILKSQSDPLVSSREAADMAHKIKLSQLAVLDETSHFLASRHQEKIIGAITDFLKENKLLLL